MANLSVVPKWVKKEQTDLWVSETWRLILLGAGHTPTASHRYISDVIANEIVDPAGKYTAGGVAVGVKVSVADSDNYYLDLPDAVIGPNATLNYKYAILAKWTGNQATSLIRAQVDFEEPQIVTNGASTIVWNALGLLYVQ